MNLLQSLYCNQYLELKQQGKEYAASRNGNVIVTVALLCNFVTVVLLFSAISSSFAHTAGDGVKSVFGSGGGRTVGKLIAIVLLAIIFPVVKFTIGKKENFDKTIAAFEALPEKEQKAVARRGLMYFFISIGASLLSGFILAL